MCNQSLETVCWSRDGAEFMSAHNDGSFIIWNARKLSKPDGPHTPYGPFPCKSMTRVSWVTTDRSARHTLARWGVTHTGTKG